MADVSRRFDAGAWEFDDAVVAAFDDHVVDNVPYYEVVQDIVAHLSDWLAPDGALVVDLGASTGETIARVSSRHPRRSLTFVAYDVEQAMLDAARAKHEALGIPHVYRYEPIDLVEGLLGHFSADLTLALFTLQFIRPHERLGVLRRARGASRPGSAIIVAEKVTQPSALWQEIANEATWDYKAARGVPAESIREKARAIRGVLVPLDPRGVEDLLREAGWGEPVPIWRWHQWAVFAAIHPE